MVNPELGICRVFNDLVGPAAGLIVGFQHTVRGEFTGVVHRPVALGGFHHLFAPGIAANLRCAGTEQHQADSSQKVFASHLSALLFHAGIQGVISISVPSSTICQISSIAALETAIHPSVQSERLRAPRSGVP